MENNNKNNEKTKFVRFEGLLLQDQSFTLIPGWETTNVKNLIDSKIDISLRVNTIDKENRVINSMHPNVMQISSCEGTQTSFRHVICYIPISSDVSSIQLIEDGEVRYIKNLCSEPPVVKIKKCELIDDNKLKLEWMCEHSCDNPIYSNIFVLQLSSQKIFTLYVRLPDFNRIIDMKDYYDQNGIHILISVTDGLRSSSVASDLINTDRPLPQVQILEPKPNTTFPADKPIGLMGKIVDFYGSELVDDKFVWYLNNQEIDIKHPISIIRKVDPGNHKLKLVYKDQGQEYAKEIDIRVLERTNNQKKTKLIIEKLDKLSNHQNLR